MHNKVKMGDLLRKYGIVLILVVEIVIFALTTKNFATVDNVFLVLRQGSILGIVCIGEMLAILLGGIDLSVGSVVGLSLIVCAKLLLAGASSFLACLGGIGCGLLVGLLNGFLIASVGIVPLIATLGTEIAVRGFVYIITNAIPIFGFDSSFRTMGQGYVFNIVPIPVVILAGMLILAWIYLNKTKLGRYTYAVGGNAEVARLSGISVKKIKYLSYMISGFCAGFGGCIMLSRLFSGQPRAGLSLEMDAITAVVLGGVSVAGGQGSLVGVVIGVFIMGVLSNGLVMLGVNDYWQQFLQGIVLLIAVGFDVMASKRKYRFAGRNLEKNAGRMLPNQ